MAYAGIETRVEDEKVRCELCLKYNISYRGNWIALRTYKTKHQKTDIHLVSIAHQAKEMDVENQRLQAMPGYFVTPKNIDAGAGPSSLPTYGRPSAEDQMRVVWDDFDGTFELEDGAAELQEKARKAFEHEANLSGLWAGLEEVPDNDINEIQQCWEQEEQDDLLAEILEQIGMIP